LAYPVADDFFYCSLLDNLFIKLSASMWRFSIQAYSVVDFSGVAQAPPE